MLRNLVGPLAVVSSLLTPIAAKTRTYDFNVTWVTSNPDGAFDRPTIGINGQWPIPQITADVGDRIVVNLENQLGNQTTSLHFHGLYQNGTTHMDGPARVTQCEVPPGQRFTYNFTIDQPGTYWYHSHAEGQYPDGIRGPLIIHDPDMPFKDMYDEELVMTMSDWYHDQIHDLLKTFISKGNPTGAEPVPDSVLVNETTNLKVPVQPGKTYLFRLINIGAFAAQWVWFEGHNITIVEVDGVYTQPAEAEMIYVSPAQRYSFLLTTKNSTDQNYPFVTSMDTSLFDVLPDELQYNSSNWLQYDESKPFPEAAILEDAAAFDDLEFDDVTLVAYDNMTRLGEPDQEIVLDVIMDNLGDGANYAFFNNITYKAAKVPTLYTAMTTGEDAANPAVYGEYTHSFVLKKDEIVQIVVNNLDSGKHPFHLHGHAFQGVYRSDDEAGTYEDSGITEADMAEIPMRRDTMVVRPEGFMVLRFKADNPGIWLFHCHIEWHLSSGLIATMVENPLELQKTLQIPQNHFDVCKAGNVLTDGNAAGNTKNFLDLTGQNAPPGPLPEGFTTRGKVALAFSILAGLLGVATVAWYGLVAAPADADHYAADTFAGTKGGAHTTDPVSPASGVVESKAGAAAPVETTVTSSQSRSS